MKKVVREREIKNAEKVKIFKEYALNFTNIFLPYLHSVRIMLGIFWNVSIKPNYLKYLSQVIHIYIYIMY